MPSSRKLGLLGLNLAAAACFFVEPWRQVAAQLSPAAQAWLLDEAGHSEELADAMAALVDQPK